MGLNVQKLEKADTLNLQLLGYCKINVLEKGE